MLVRAMKERSSKDEAAQRSPRTPENRMGRCQGREEGEREVLVSINSRENEAQAWESPAGERQEGLGAHEA